MVTDRNPLPLFATPAHTRFTSGGSKNFNQCRKKSSLFGIHCFRWPIVTASPCRRVKRYCDRFMTPAEFNGLVDKFVEKLLDELRLAIDQRGAKRFQTAPISAIIIVVRSEHVLRGWRAGIRTSSPFLRLIFWRLRLETHDPLRRLRSVGFPHSPFQTLLACFGCA